MVCTKVETLGICKKICKEHNLKNKPTNFKVYTLECCWISLYVTQKQNFKEVFNCLKKLFEV